MEVFTQVAMQVAMAMMKPDKLLLTLMMHGDQSIIPSEVSDITSNLTSKSTTALLVTTSVNEMWFNMDWSTPAPYARYGRNYCIVSLKLAQTSTFIKSIWQMRGT